MEGLCLVNAMHITASVFINDNEPGLHHDYELWLEKLAPHAPTNAYRHNRTGEDNADAHLKRQIMGRDVVVAITKGKLDFGPWEQIFYGEFDGRRKKRVLVKIIGDRRRSTSDDRLLACNSFRPSSLITTRSAAAATAHARFGNRHGSHASPACRRPGVHFAR